MIARDIRPGMTWSGIPVARVDEGFYGGYIFWDEYGRPIAMPSYDDADPAELPERPGKVARTESVPGDGCTPPGPASTVEGR